MKQKLITTINVLFLISLALVFFKPSFTGFIIHEPISGTNDVNLTIENDTFVVGTNFTLTLYQISNNWSNYTSINISITGTQAVLLTQDHYDLNSFIDYSDISWNFSANQVGVARINITLANATSDKTSHELQLNIISGIDASRISLNVPQQNVLNGEDFSINVSHESNDWSDFQSLTIYYNDQTIIPTSPTTTSTSVLTAHFEVNFTAIDNKINNVTLEITDVHGQKTNITRNITIYNNTCPEPSHFTCSDGSLNNPRLENCSYEFITQTNQNRIRFYFNATLALDGVSNYSMIYDFNGLTASKYSSSYGAFRTYDAISSIDNVSMREYNLTALLISSSGRVCEYSETFDLTDPYSDITLEPVFSGLPFCENLIGLMINDTNVTDGNFSGLANITISSLDGLLNNSEIIIFNNSGNESMIYFDNIICEERRSYGINLTYDGAINRIKSVNLYNPSCQDINIYNENDQIKLNYTNAFTGTYWEGFESFDYFLYSQDAINNVISKNLDSLNNIHVLNTSLNHFNNESRETTYFLNVTFNFTEEYYDASCVYPYSFTKNETSDPNITVVWTNTVPDKSLTDPYEFIFNITNHQKNNVTFKIDIMQDNIAKCTGYFNFTDLNDSFKMFCSLPFPSQVNYEVKSTSNYSKSEDDTQYKFGENDFWVTEFNRIFDLTPEETITSSSAPRNGNGIITGIVASTSVSNPKPVIIEQPLFIDPALAGFLGNKLDVDTTYSYRRGETYVTHTLRNTHILPIEDIKLYAVIPKYIAKNASEIKGDFIVNESDPVIVFNVEEIRPGRKIELEYSFNRTINASLLQNITIFVETKINETLLNDTLKRINDTINVVNVSVDVVKEDNKTSFTTVLETDKNLTNVKVYVEIPKCLAKYIKDLEIENKDYEVIKDDPIIAWTFDEISDKIDLNFKVLKEIDQECYDQIKVLPIAGQIEDILRKDEVTGKAAEIIVVQKTNDGNTRFIPIIIIVIAVILLPIISKYSKVLEKDEHKDKHFLHKDIIRDLEIGFEEFAFILIIGFDVLDFFRIFPPLMDFTAKIVSTTLLAILIYKTNLHKIFFGEESKILDFILIFAYFLLFIKDFLAIANELQKEIIETGKQSLLTQFNNLIGPYANEINLVSISISAIIIIMLALFKASKEVKTPSLMGTLHEEGRPRNIFSVMLRFITINLIYFGFFVIIFNFIIEWLAISANSTITVAVIIVYLIIFFSKHHEHYDVGSIIYRIGNTTEEFYEAFIELLQKKEGLFLAISGMLVLHLIIDVANYLIPYLVYLSPISYYNEVTHTTLIPILRSVFESANIFYALKISGIYLINITAITICLIIPGMIWYKIYNNNKFGISRWLIALFYASILIMFILPAFSINELPQESVAIGVDIELLEISEYSINPYAQFLTSDLLLMASLGVFIIIFLLTYNKYLNCFLEFIAGIFIFLFFGGYISSYLESWVNYFMFTITELFRANNIVIGMVLSIFFFITVLFYVLGYFMFLYLVWSHWIEKKPMHIETYTANIVQTAKPSEPVHSENQELIHTRVIGSDDSESKKNELTTQTYTKGLIQNAYIELKIGQAREYIEKSPDKEIAKQKLIQAGWKKEVIEKL